MSEFEKSTFGVRVCDVVRKCVSHYQKCDLTIPLPQVGVSQWVGGISLASYLRGKLKA